MMFFEQQNRPRRGRYARLRVIAEAQPKLYLIPRVLRVLPLGQLVAPRSVMLRAAKTGRARPRYRASQSRRSASPHIFARTHSGPPRARLLNCRLTMAVLS
jgi:hypothetical protein